MEEETQTKKGVIMEFVVHSIYDGDWEEKVEINTIEDLKSLPRRLKANLDTMEDKDPDHHGIWQPHYALIVEFKDDSRYSDNVITIYDWYRE